VLFYDFPVESGFKMILGFSALGFFAATDLALRHEYLLAERVQREGIKISPQDHYFPLVRKFSLFASFSVVFLLAVFFLLISKDLEWLLHASKDVSLDKARLLVMMEFTFVGLVLIAYMLNVIYSYVRNLNYYFGNENRVLEDVASGTLDSDHLVTVSTHDEFGVMALHTNTMVKTLYERTHDLQRTQDVTILSLASLAETRDNETGAHILRTQHYVRALALTLKDHPKFSAELDDETIELLYKSAPLHDIGKVGIPDHILLKPGKLDDAEFETMKTHTTLGSNALLVAEQGLGDTSFLRYAREIAQTHHEKWDGSGYPAGLKGDEIPVSGRLMAVADVYDALISKRVYKPAFSHQKAVEIILEGRGSHFDPDIIDSFIAIQDEFLSIANQYRDENLPPLEKSA